ncbi:MAG: CvpA family protein [Dehalogenimonas sp.]|jgi:membrane protein required for colicin V production|uniref:CvpA family protein n=1 Tax=Candidatus Dehalogenimonas loeffleri TaxID=3127115 RepID=A0ABZ2J4B8_9CHLR|nr:CvpA family protein [Dehalogenimonas sp.]
MNWLDIVILVILALLVFRGLTQGLIKSLAGLLGLIVGVVLAGRFHESLAGSLFSFISNPDWANIVAYVAIILAVWIIFAVIAGILTRLASIVFLGWVNRLGGAVFALLMGVFIIGAALAAWAKFFGGDALTDSFMAGFLLDKFPFILSLLPSQFDTIKDFFQ